MMKIILVVKKNEVGVEMELNLVYMMVYLGVWGLVSQMKQLGGMCGLMVKLNGEIIEMLIILNFKEGLIVFEYFNLIYGVWKGLLDMVLKMVNLGYLICCLVDVVQDCIICEYDCGIDCVIIVLVVVNDGEVVSLLSECVLGCVVVEDVLVFGEDVVIVCKNEIIDECKVDEIEQVGVQIVCICLGLICEVEDGICVLCYGCDFVCGMLVNIGEVVGIIVVQLIGEFGMQLMMWIFYIGGIV